MKALVESLNPLLNFYVYALDFGVLNHLKRRLINMNSTICEIMLRNQHMQGGSLVMKFG